MEKKPSPKTPALRRVKVLDDERVGQATQQVDFTDSRSTGWTSKRLHYINIAVTAISVPSMLVERIYTSFEALQVIS